MSNESLVIWVLEYFDNVAGDSSIDLYKTEDMARSNAKKLSEDGTIESYIVYPRRVWE